MGYRGPAAVPCDYPGWVRSPAVLCETAPMSRYDARVNHRLLRGALMAVLLLFSAGSHGGRGGLKLKQVRTEFMRLIYLSDEHYFLIPHLTRCFENSLRFHRELFDYTPDEYVTLIFQDMDDHGYAGTTTMPYNYLTLGIEPFEHVYETSPTNERINWVMSHELLHVVAADQASGTDRFFRKIFFGKVAPTDERPRVDLLQLPDQPPPLRPPLVPRGPGRLHGDLDGRRHRPRPERLRRDGLPVHGPRQQLFLRHRRDRIRRARRRISRWASCPTSTAPVSSATWPTGTVPKRSSMGQAAAGDQALLRPAVQARLRPGHR